MNILLIDCTSAHCYVAVVTQDNIIDGSSYHCGTKHSEVLCGLVADVLDKAQLSFAELDAVSCGIGTGSFTGIRIGVATVLGYHRASNVPLIALPSLQAMHIHSGSSAVAMDAGNGYYYAEYSNGTETVSPQLVQYSDDRLEDAYKYDKQCNYIQAYAELARLLYNNGSFTTSLEPLYIRKSQAEMNL